MRIYIGIGSNTGGRKENIFRAVCLFVLGKNINVTNLSPLYETSPVLAPGAATQGDYLNCAVECETNLSPECLLRRLQAIERKLGRKRVRARRWAPRPLDLDLLFYGDRVVGSKGLAVPHPALHRRKFVLKPLLDLAPGFEHPVLRKNVRRLYRELKDDSQRLKEIS